MKIMKNEDFASQLRLFFSPGLVAARKEEICLAASILIQN